MKISVENIRFFNLLYKTAGDPMAGGIDELVEKVNTQLGGVDEVIDLGKKYKGILVANVVECIKHPNADKLSLCKIDDNGTNKSVERDKNGLVQVVCGAPNVREGMLVAWIPPGVTVPNTYEKDPFVLEARELRGEISNGMLASASELDISSDHNGIVELGLDRQASPGQPFADVYKLDDYIVDIENKMFTHRPDLFGMLGVARELAGISGQKFTSPDWYKNPIELEKAGDLALEVGNQIPELAPRFMAVAIQGVQVGPSPLWLQINLMRVGIKPVNNVVDLTNYWMHITAQPMHAYDYDKVKALSGGSSPKLVIRNATQDEQLKLLGGKTTKVKSTDIVIATDKQVIALGGVMGGADTEVDHTTKNIILECANFDMYRVRRTSMAHGLFTDASMRFTKGQSPLQCPAVIGKTATDILRICKGKVASEVIDLVGNESFTKKVKSVATTVDFINSLLGLSISETDTSTLLENVEFGIERSVKDIKIHPPFWRTDIETPEDVAEEVGRLYGFNRLPKALPKRVINPATSNALIDLKNRLRQNLSALGANEVLTYNFVHGKLLEKVGQKPENSYKLRNALSPDLQYYRQTLTPNLLDNVHANIKAGHDQFAIFEIGKSHNKIHSTTDDLPDELEMLALTFAEKKPAKDSGSAYFKARKYLDELASKLGIELDYSKTDEKLDYPVTAPYDLKRSALVSDKKSGDLLGIIGEYKNSVCRDFKLPPSVAGFELGLEHILKSVRQNPLNSYEPLAKYPATEQDICLRIDSGLSYKKLLDEITSLAQDNKPKDVNISISPIDIYQDNKVKTRKQITVRIRLQSFERTLTSTVVNELIDQISVGAEKQLGAVRV